MPIVILKADILFTNTVFYDWILGVIPTGILKIFDLNKLYKKGIVMNILNNYYNIIRAVHSAKKNGFFHIIISSSLVKVVSFISAMFLPRIISDKADYGLLVYVDNIRSYFMLFNGFGIANATLRYCVKVDNNENKKGIFLSTLIVGIIFDVLMILGSIIAFIFIPFQFEGAERLLIFMSILPLFMFLFEDIQLFLRANFENKRYSILSFFYSVMIVIGQIGFALLYGLNGVAIGRYIAVISSIFLGGIFLSKTNIAKIKANFPMKKEIWGMMRFGIVMLLCNSISYVMQLNETFILGAMLKDEVLLADYRVASYILVISTFIVQSVAVFIFPYFTKHMNDKKWIWENFKKLTMLNGIIMIPIHLVLILVSPLIISVVFGEQYKNAVPIMQMLLVASYGQTSFRMLTGNVLSATGEEKFNLKINIIFMVLHVIIDVWAVSTFGIYGAAIALACVYYVSGIVMILHLRKICHDN